MNKQINLIINGKGGVGNSYHLRHVSDRRVLHRAIDSEGENSTLKPFTAAAKPKTAKTLNFLIGSFAARGSSLRNFKDFAPHSRETVIARCFPPQVPPRPFIPTTRDHCGVLRIAYALATLRVSRFPILWLGARSKGIARFAALHLDTCSLRPEEVVMISREEICRSQKRGKRFVPRPKLLRLLNKGSRPFILQDEILDRRWTGGLVLAQIRAQSMISQQEP